MTRSLSLGALAVAALVVATLPVASAQTGARRSFVYLNNNGHGQPNSVSGLEVAGDGTLSVLRRSPVASGGTGNGSVTIPCPLVATTAAGDRLFVVNNGSRDLSVFDVNPATGRTRRRGEPFAISPVAESSTLSVAATPDGRFVYVGDQVGGRLHAYAVSAAGQLSAVPGSPFVVVEYPISLEVSSNGRLLAVAYSGNNKVGVYRIGADGALSDVAGSPHPADPTSGAALSVDFTCAGDRLVAVQGGGDHMTVNVYSVGEDGRIAPVAGSPFTPELERNPIAAALSPDDRFLFVGCSDGVATLRIEPDGRPSLVDGSPFALGFNGASGGLPGIIATDVTGRFLYTGSTGVVYMARVEDDGRLVALPGSPLRVEGSFNFTSLVVTPPKSCVAAVGPRLKNGKLLLDADGSNIVAGARVTVDGVESFPLSATADGESWIVGKRARSTPGDRTIAEIWADGLPHTIVVSNPYGAPSVSVQVTP